MAELVGTVSAITGLIGAAFKLSQLTYDYVNSTRHASKLVSGFLQELLALSSVLLAFKETINSSSFDDTLNFDQRLLFSGAIKNCETDIDQIKQKLEKYNPAQFRLKNMVWPLQEKETKTRVETLHRWRSTFESLIVNATSDTSKLTLREVRSVRSETQRSKVIDWLSQGVLRLNNNELFAQHCIGTCEWILQNDSFLSWTASAGSILSCYGNPGAGKTILSSFIIHHLQKSQKGAFVLYHHFDFRTERKHHTPDIVCRSLLRQLALLYSDVPPAILTLYEEATNLNDEISHLQLVETLLQVLESLTSYIVFDALDECADRGVIYTLLRRLAATDANLLLMSRPLVDLPKDLKLGNSIDIAAKPTDILTYFMSKLDEDEDLAAILPKPFRDEVGVKIVDHADGIFLLAKMAVDLLATATTTRHARKLLLQLPQTLTIAYQSTFDRILNTKPASKRDVALKALSWVYNAERPLTMEELLNALAVEPDDEEIDVENMPTAKLVLNSCLGLIRFDEPDNTVLLIHATVSEFFQNECKQYFQTSRLDIAKCCLTYLVQKSLVEKAWCSDGHGIEKRLLEFPLLGFVATNWGFYTVEYENDLTTYVDKFLAQPRAIANSSQVLHYLRRIRHATPEMAYLQIPRSFSWMHVLSYWNLSITASRHHNSNLDAERADKFGWTPLHWATARGNVEMVKFLLQRVYNNNLEVCDKRGWTALFWGVFWGRQNTVACLLDAGARKAVFDTEGQTPLHLAVSRRDEAICEMLLADGASWNVADHHGQTSWDLCIRSHDQRLIALFTRFSDTPAVSAFTYPVSELEKAADIGDDGSFQWLLEKERLASKLETWTHPFSDRAKKYGQQLISSGYHRSAGLGRALAWDAEELLSELDLKSSMFLYAILFEQTKLVRMLARHGVDISQPFKGTYVNDHFTWMHAAAFANNEALCSCLLSMGANPNEQDDKGMTPLHYSVLLGHLEVAKVLCKNENSLHTRDKSMRYALHLSTDILERQHQQLGSPTDDTELIGTCSSLIELLFRDQADLNTQDEEGQTPLHYAIKARVPEIVNKMLQLGASPNIRARKKEPKTEDGHTPFTLACSYDERSIIQLLLNHGVKLPEDISLEGPLITAIKNADIDMVHQFLTIGARNESAVPSIVIAINALEQSIKSGSRQDKSLEDTMNEEASKPSKPYQSLIQILIDAGEDINAKDDHGNTPLLLALKYPYMDDASQFLLDSGANIDSTNAERFGAMHSVAISGSTQLAKQMISRGAYINLQSNTKKIPISIAASNGHTTLVEILLVEIGIAESEPTAQKWLTTSKLYNAIQSQDVDAFQDLISLPDFLDSVDSDGQTFLHQACQSGTDMMVETLAKLDIDLNTQDIRGNTALHIAICHNRDIDLISLLLDHGAKLDITNKSAPISPTGLKLQDRSTPFHIAVAVGNVDVVNMILDFIEIHENLPTLTTIPVNSWYNIANKDRSLIDRYCGQSNFTPLMIAVQQGDLEIGKLLIDHGATVNIGGGYGSWAFTAFDIARNRGDEHMVEFLQRNGGCEWEWQ